MGKRLLLSISAFSSLSCAFPHWTRLLDRILRDPIPCEKRLVWLSIDRRALENTIRADPRELTALAVYYDWLLEHSHPQAELVALQARAAEGAKNLHEQRMLLAEYASQLAPTGGGTWDVATTDPFEPYRSIQDDVWLVRRGRSYDVEIGVAFRHGVIDQVRVSAQALRSWRIQREVDFILTVTRKSLAIHNSTRSDLTWILRLPFIQDLETLKIDFCRTTNLEDLLGDHRGIRILAERQLPVLRSISLADTLTGPHELGLLRRAPWFPQLRYLNLQRTDTRPGSLAQEYPSLTVFY